MEYIIQNWDTILTAVLALVGAASVIAKLTPTPKDDAVLAKVKSVVEAIALNPKK